MKIGIIGYGIVGKATEKSFTSGHEVIIFDLDNGRFSDMFDCDLVFICMSTNSIQDLDILKSYCTSLSMPVIIRSTITPGFTRSLDDNIMFMPEFLRERHWERDCVDSYKILGTDSPVDIELLKLLGYPQVVPTGEAEMVKMMSNVFAALKITCANHFYNYSKELDIDYSVVRNLLQKTYTNQDYLEVTDSMRGFGGKCLPKDLELLLHEMGTHSLKQTLFTAVKNDNSLWPITIRDD
tara:strand:- start:1947 stop:2660 length:714 start_codon:yes stop_codon:yes gene_type:complete